MKLDKSHIGKKVINGRTLELLLGVASNNEEIATEDCDGKLQVRMNFGWELYQEPQESVLMSPAVSIDQEDNPCIGDDLFKEMPGFSAVVQWPLKVVLKNAKINGIGREGFINLEFNGDPNLTISGELWIEVPKGESK